MLTYNQEFQLILENLLDEETDTEMANLSNGTALDFGEYKWRAGVIYGLRKAKELCEAAESKLNRQ